MKTNYALLLLGFLFLSCSSDNTSEDIPSATNYYPSGTGNFWVYDVEGTPVGRDSLYISGDTLINSVAYKRFKTKMQPVGFYSNSLNKNGVRKSEDKLLVSGTIGLNFTDQFPLTISISDFTAFKESASPNEVLGTVSGSFQQNVQGYPLTIEYTFTSKAVGSLASFTSPNNDVYTDVKSVNTILNVKISTIYQPQGVPISIPVTILPAQDVIVSTQYYAKNIGVVHTNTDMHYQLASLPVQVQLPIPSSGDQNQKEFLDTYQIN
ncbi:hypothetical protein [Flavobacterium humi]|uniref:Lipoprotein n=1 Tax=Flavobacterium humi TaxID=2562683 RepID=A0A4Z0LB09_9FLAO|nr:hypothetical protein [Flavobacterium humi]TGD58365.1 hypothetical protein E4635_05485 [Flavobacterium humi]